MTVPDHHARDLAAKIASYLVRRLCETVARVHGYFIFHAPILHISRVSFRDVGPWNRFSLALRLEFEMARSSYGIVAWDTQEKCMSVTAIRFDRWFVVFMSLIGSGLFVGCTQKAAKQVPVYQTRGMVYLDGEPLSGATLMFHSETEINGPDGRPIPVPGAMTKDDGSFVASTYLHGDGLPVGDYLVTISCENRQAKPVRDEYPELLPPQYQNPAKSGLVVSITQGRNELDVMELKSLKNSGAVRVGVR